MPAGRRPWYFRVIAALLLVLAASPFTVPFGTCDLVPPASSAAASVAAKGKLPEGFVLGGSVPAAPMAGVICETLDASQPSLALPGTPSLRLFALRL